MNAQVLIEYLAGSLPVGELVLFLRRLRGRTHLVEKDGFFDDCHKTEVTIWNLVRICDDFLSGCLDSMSMETLAFLIVGTDALYWDSDTATGAVVADTLDDWASPDLAYPLTPENIEIIREGLVRGECLGGEVCRLNT